MSTARYPALSVELEDRIRAGYYHGGFPTMRELRTEFQTSLSTVSKALEPLLKRRLLVSAGCRRGIRIDEKRCRTPRGVIGLVSRDEMMNDGILMQRLVERCRADGFEPELIVFNSRHFARNLEKLFPRHFAGVIFAFSSLTVEAAMWLRGAQIPFVSGNVLQVLPGLNYVEHNHAGAWRQLVRALQERGYRKIGIFFPSQIESIYDYCRSIWRELAQELEVPGSACEKFIPDWTLDIYGNLVSFLHFMAHHDDWPDALIYWNGGIGAEVVKRCFAGDGSGLPARTLLVGIPEPGIAGNPRIALVQTLDYMPLMDALYQALRERIMAPDAPPLRRLVDYPIEFLQPIPERRVIADES